MSFLKSLGKALKVGEAVAPTVATAINPAAGALVGMVVHSVTQAEQAGGTGAQKKEQVLKDVLPAAASVVNATLQGTDTKTQVNSAQLSTAVGSLIDGVVGLMNSVQATPAAAAAAASAPTTAPATAPTAAPAAAPPAAPPAGTTT